jgi:hypothetical protein
MRFRHEAGSGIRIAVAVGLLLGCTGDRDSGSRATPTGVGTPSRDAEPAPEGWTVCTNVVEGFAIEHPADWYTTDVVFGVRDRSGACRYLAREPFDRERGAEPNDEGLTYPIQIYTQGNDAQTIVGAEGVRVVSREDITVASRSATRLETLVTEPSLGEPEGTYYRYLIDTPDGRQFTFITADYLDRARYEENKRILDRVVGTLTFE